MSDLEQRLADALTEGAQGAPSATGLASAAGGRGPAAGDAAASRGAPRWWRSPSGCPAPCRARRRRRAGQGLGPADHGNPAVDKNGDDGQDSVPSLAGGLQMGELARR